MKVVCLILFSMFLLGCERTDENVLDHIIIKNSNVEVYSDTYLYDLFDTKNVELKTENKLLNTKHIGEKTYTIEYLYDKKTYEYDLIYNVVDTEAPRYFGGTNKTILKNYEGELCDLVMYGDNYDSNPTCIIEGHFDLSKTGKYKVIYNITDNSNNTIKINVTLNIIDKKKTSSSTTQAKKTEFSDILKKYKNKNTEVGIDVSKWQGEINFEKVRNAGATFVMIRIGVQTKQNGELTIDPYYEQNIKNAKSAGLKVGVYSYSVATSVEEVNAEARAVLEILQGRDLDFPVALDLEDSLTLNATNNSQRTNMVHSFKKIVEDAGYQFILYANLDWLNNYLDNARLDGVDIWIARYCDPKLGHRYTGGGNVTMWQYTSTGSVDGISGNVDLDFCYKAY